MIIACVIVLTILGLGLLSVGYGARLEAIRVKQDAEALLTAEAGYEQALFWMGQQNDLRKAVKTKSPEGALDFQTSICDYDIRFYDFFGVQPAYRIKSNGHCGRAHRTIDVLVTQAVGRWESNKCRVPDSPWTDRPVSFAHGDVIDMPLHINRYGDPADLLRDIHISGDPCFLRPVSMGESRYARAGSRDKYKTIMPLFNGGIYFDQPNVETANYEKLTTQAKNFKNNSVFKFKPRKNIAVKNSVGAVQLEFYVTGTGEGRVLVTDDCTVQLNYPPGPWDYKVGTSTPYEPYNPYAYHYVGQTKRPRDYQITDTYVTDHFGSYRATPGGQIYVDGNVIIGGETVSKLKGRLTVVATGNIWIVNSVEYDDAGGKYRTAEGLPTADNPNVLGLVSTDGVVKVIDTALSAVGGIGPKELSVLRLKYEPVAYQDPRPGSQRYDRLLPDSVVVEAAITCGAGGWGVENAGNRMDLISRDLIVNGSISEAIRGVTGSTFQKKYHLDERLLDGILPGNIWLQSKYVPVPGGWSDYRSPDTL